MQAFVRFILWSLKISIKYEIYSTQLIQPRRS
jgi:hypothetical protein